MLQTNLQLDPRPDSAYQLQLIEPFDVAALFRSLWQGKWIIMATAIFAVIAAGYYAFFIATPQFAATATVQVELNQNQAAEAYSQGFDPAQINTEAAILRSKHVLEQVVQDLDLINDPEFNRYLTPIAPWSFDGLRARIRVIISGETIVRPSENAILAKTVENLASALTTGPERDTYIFAVTATTETPAKSGLIANTLVSTYLAEQFAAKTAQTDAAVQHLSDRVAELQQALKEKETAINALISGGQLQDNASFDALSRQAIDAEERLAEAQRSLSLSPENAAHLADQIPGLERFRARLTAQIADQSSGLVALHQLRRETESTRILYTNLLTQLQHTQMQRGLHAPSARILSPAGDGRHVGPRKLIILAVALILGAAAGVGIVVWRRSHFVQRDTVGTIMGTDVLATLPYTPKSRLLNSIANSPTGKLAEATCHLRTALMLGKANANAQVIVATSSDRQDGQTIATLALAASLARLGKSALVIDANMRGGQLSGYFTSNPRPMLEHLISGSVALSEAVISDPRIAADIICTTRTDQNPADLFSSTGFAQLIHAARNSYDYVIIDAPPVVPFSDSQIIAGHADYILFCVRQGKTPTRTALAGQSALRSVEAPITGIIVIT